MAHRAPVARGERTWRVGPRPPMVAVRSGPRPAPGGGPAAALDGFSGMHRSHASPPPAAAWLQVAAGAGLVCRRVAVGPAGPHPGLEPVERAVAEIGQRPGRWVAVLAGDREELRYLGELVGAGGGAVVPLNGAGRQGELVATLPDGTAVLAVLDGVRTTRGAAVACLRVAAAEDAVAAARWASGSDGSLRPHGVVVAVAGEDVVVASPVATASAPAAPVEPAPVPAPAPVAPRRSWTEGRPMQVVVALVIAATVLGAGAAWWRAHQGARTVATPAVTATPRPFVRVPPSVPPARSQTAAAFDPPDGVVLVFGGSSGARNGPPLADTWAWDGWRWRSLPSPRSPSPRMRAAMGYDPHLQGVVLAAGFDGSDVGDTWLWQRDGWRRLWEGGPDQPHGPATMVYDHARGQLVLVACCQPDTRRTLATWVPDSTGWRRLPNGLGQFSGAQLVAADDAVRGRVVVAGDAFDGTGLLQAWEWDGTRWSAAGPGPRPAFDPLAQLVWDPLSAHVLYLRPGQGAAPETWAWDGHAWTQLPNGGPDWVSVALTVESTGAAVAFGGSVQEDDFAVAWQWSGTTWEPQDHVAVAPAVTAAAGVVHDPLTGGAVSFGGVITPDQTWRWDGVSWSRLRPPSSPPKRVLTALADDPGRHRVLLFGGAAPAGPELADTWTWDGRTWTEQHPAHSPPASGAAVMAADPAHGVVVLVELCCQAGVLAGSVATWTWDGRDWSRPLLAQQPPSPSGAGMAYDPATRRMLYASGIDPRVPDRSPSETWSWDGRTWTRIASLPRPPSTLARLATDSSTGHVVALVPAAPARQSLDTFEWDGSGWNLRGSLLLHAGVLGPLYVDSLHSLVAFGSSAPSDDNTPAVADQVWTWDGRTWALRGN